MGRYWDGDSSHLCSWVLLSVAGIFLCIISHIHLLTTRELMKMHLTGFSLRLQMPWTIASTSLLEQRSCQFTTYPNNILGNDSAWFSLNHKGTSNNSHNKKKKLTKPIEILAIDLSKSYEKEKSFFLYSHCRIFFNFVHCALRKAFVFIAIFVRIRNIFSKGQGLCILRHVGG
jgi:hypothetical protein